MNPETGELVEVKPGEELPPGFELIPDEFKHDAAKLLQFGTKRVPINEESRLSQWRRDKLRQQNKQLARRRRNNKQQKKSR